MRRSDVTLTIALCLSLVLHALLCVGAAERYIHGTRVWFPGSPAEAQAASLYIDEPTQRPTPEGIQMRLGDTDGKGTAIDASPGDDPLIAPRGFQDQPFLSRDPVGPGKVGDEPTESTMLPGDGSAAAAVAATPPAPTQAAVFGLNAPRVEIEQPFEPKPAKPSTSPPDVGGDQPIDVEASERADEVSPASIERQPAAAPPAQAASAGANPGPLTAADPAPKSDSEIDPTSVSRAGEGMDLRRGATEARAGRKHKLTRPRLNLAARADLTAIQTGNLVLKIRIDGEGNVKHVQVLKSSGSEALDQICKVAAYEWWFEPLKDRSGRAIHDDFPFTIVF